MEHKVAVFRKEHFNAAHRLFCADWSDEKNNAIFGKCNNPNFHGHNYTLEVWIDGEKIYERSSEADPLYQDRYLPRKFKIAIAIPPSNDVDVFSMVSDESLAYINFMKVINGTILQSQTWEVKKKLEEDEAELLTMLIWEKRDQFQSKAKEIITNIPMSIEFEGAKNTLPSQGDKRKLLDMSLKNVLYFRKEKADRKAAEESGGDRKMRVMIKLKNDLRLNDLPKHIECFDNSNLQGTNPVSAMVCVQSERLLRSC